MKAEKRIGPVQVAATMVGTIVGAGFASGQEIFFFFARHGVAGLAGVATATILFCALGAGLLDLARRLGTTSYGALLRYLGGSTLGRIADTAMTVVLLGIVGVMLAGAGAGFVVMGWPQVLGIIITLTVGLSAVLGGLRGVLMINDLVVPVMIVFTLVIALLSLTHPGSASGGFAGRPAGGHWLLSALVYVSYNITLSIPVIAPLGQATSRRTALVGGMAAGIALGVMILAITLTLMTGGAHSAASEVPLLSIAARFGRPAQVAFGLVMWGEIVTTLVGDLFGVARRIADAGKIPYTVSVIIAMTLALLISRAGFARLVHTLYPAFGLTFLLLMAVLGVHRLFRGQGGRLGPVRCFRPGNLDGSRKE